MGLAGCNTMPQIYMKVNGKMEKLMDKEGLSGGAILRYERFTHSLRKANKTLKLN